MKYRNNESNSASRVNNASNNASLVNNRLSKGKAAKGKAAKGKVKGRGTSRLSFMVKPEGVSLEEWQVGLRRQIAQKGNFVVEPLHDKGSQGYYSVKKPIYAKVTLKTREGEEPRVRGYGAPYVVVYRGDGSRWNYCSCMDFKTSGLGTCKHIEAVKWWIESGGKRVARALPKESSVYVDYSDGRKIKIRIGSNDKEAIADVAKDFFDRSGVFVHADTTRLYDFLDRVARVSSSCRCYPDVYEAVGEAFRRRTLGELSRSVDDNLIQSMVKAKLFRYQLDGVKFAFTHGRTIIADEMGLGKTIQAIATAELLRHFQLATSVLVVCPTSLKYQWKHEIEKFTDASVVVVEGNPLRRKEIYERDEAYYKIISYNALANDIKYQGSMHTDLLIMDEVQRLKNWDTQIAKAARKVRSAYTVLLSGTPLENKLEELYSIVELVDQYALSPYYLFRNEYIVTDSAGMTIGYKNLNDITTRLSNLLIRRRKSEVAMQMPARMDKTLYVPMTKEQEAIHAELEFKVSIIVHKWRSYHFLSEQDRLRLLMLLGQMRMVANSTFILDQQTRFDTKIEEVCNILHDIFSSGDEKVVIFSGWERMTRLIAAELDKMGVRYSNLNGSVPSAKRKRLVEDFTDDPACRVFLSTDAGATGLNLQAGSIIINMELPWNPAVHEQRIGRIYRLGQTRNIQVINMVSERSIEQDIETKLQFKSALAQGILDNGDDSVFLPKKKFDELIETLDRIMDEKEEAAKAAGHAPAPLDDTPEDQADDSEPKAPEDEALSPVPAPVADDADEDEVAEPAQGGGEASATPSTAHPVEPSPSPSAAHAVETPSPSSQSSGSTGSSAVSSNAAGSNAAGSNAVSSATPSSNVADSGAAADASPSQLVRQGVTFLTGLAETLKSPERTQALVNEIVTTDAETGQTCIRIPVANKETVTNLLSLVGALFSK